MTTVLNFFAGNTAYGMPVEYVLEVIPGIEAAVVDTDVPGFIGMFLFRGLSIPLFDFCLAKTGIPAKRLLSTRIMVLSWDNYRVGLLAERVVELRELDDNDTEGCVVIYPWDIIPGRVCERGVHEA